MKITRFLKKSDLRVTLPRHMALYISVYLKNAIGRENAISKEDLFKAIFKKKMDESLADWARWEYVKKGMRYLRTKSKCRFFISPIKQNGQIFFYLVNSENDAKPYIDLLQKNVAKIKYMQRKAKKAGMEAWGSNQLFPEELLDYWEENVDKNTRRMLE